MKFSITTAAFLALLHGLAAGDLYLYEGFAGYASGQLPGQAISSLAVGLDTTTSIIGGGTAAVNSLGAVGLELGNLQVSGGRALYSSPTGAASYIGFRYNGPEVTGTFYSSFLTRIETSQNNASSVGLRVNTLNNASGASSYFYTFADTAAGTRTGIQYENAAAGTVSSSQTLPLNEVYAVIGRFTRVGLALSPQTPGLATTFVLTATQFDHFKAGGFIDEELDNAPIGTGTMEVFSRVSDAAVTSGSFNILSSGRGIQFGVGNAGANQTVSYDEIRMGSSLDAVLPLQVSSSAVVSLSTSRALAPEPVAGNDAPGEIMATRVGSTESALTIQFVSSGTAIVGVDYLPLTSLTFPPGEDTVTLAVKPLTDSIAENDETVTYTVAGGIGYTLGESSAATITITDRLLGMDSSKSRFIQKMDAGIPQKIVVYGTSLTAAGQWSSQMLTALQFSYPGLVTLVNSGGSGMESDWGVANLQTRVLDQNPDVVFIEFSVNDSVDRFNLTLARANANLAPMMNGIKAARPECEIILQVMNPVITPFSPPSGLAQRLFQEPPAKSKFLAVRSLPQQPIL